MAQNLLTWVVWMTRYAYSTKFWFNDSNKNKPDNLCFSRSRVTRIGWVAELDIFLASNESFSFKSSLNLTSHLFPTNTHISPSIFDPFIILSSSIVPLSSSYNGTGHYPWRLKQSLSSRSELTNSCRGRKSFEVKLPHIIQDPQLMWKWPSATRRKIITHPRIFPINTSSQFVQTRLPLRSSASASFFQVPSFATVVPGVIMAPPDETEVSLCLWFSPRLHTKSVFVQVCGNLEFTKIFFSTNAATSRI